MALTCTRAVLDQRKMFEHEVAFALILAGTLPERFGQKTRHAVGAVLPNAAQDAGTCIAQAEFVYARAEGCR